MRGESYERTVVSHCRELRVHPRLCRAGAGRLKNDDGDDGDRHQLLGRTTPEMSVCRQDPSRVICTCNPAGRCGGDSGGPPPRRVLVPGSEHAVAPSSSKPCYWPKAENRRGFGGSVPKMSSGPPVTDKKTEKVRAMEPKEAKEGERKEGDDANLLRLSLFCPFAFHSATVVSAVGGGTGPVIPACGPCWPSSRRGWVPGGCRRWLVGRGSIWRDSPDRVTGGGTANLGWSGVDGGAGFLVL
jgi:hypothetical protein